MCLNSDSVRCMALETGFSLCGLARNRRLSEHEAFFNNWLNAGYDSSLGYLKRNAGKLFDPSAVVEGAETVIVCAVNYKNGAFGKCGGDRPKIASYAVIPDYHTVIMRMLENLLSRLQESYPGLHGRCFVDAAPLLEKAWAVEAGLGWIGGNSLLVTPEYGSLVLLGEIVTDAAADRYDAPLGEDGCGNCAECVAACPAGAVVSPRVVDTRLCISRLTNQRLPEDTPVSKSALHGWIFGCDECQACCPRNSATPLCTLPELTPVIDTGHADRRFWEEIGEEEFDRLFGVTPAGQFGLGALKRKL